MINLTMNMKSRILFGVYIIYCLRKLRSPFVFESFVFVLLATGLLYFVSIPSVLTNMSASESAYRYFVTAFSHTDFLVKSILVLVGITILFFVRNITLHAILKTRLAY